MAANEVCVAWVSEPPHYLHEHLCARPVKGEREGVGLCGIHLRATYVVLALEGPADHTRLGVPERSQDVMKKSGSREPRHEEPAEKKTADE